MGFLVALRSIVVAFFQFASILYAFGVSTGADCHVFLLHFELLCAVLRQECVCTRNYVISVPHYVPHSIILSLPLPLPQHLQQIEAAAAFDFCPPLSTLGSLLSGVSPIKNTETRTSRHQLYERP